jgi:hypothetical protein
MHNDKYAGVTSPVYRINSNDEYAGVTSPVESNHSNDKYATEFFNELHLLVH